jgi:hypothetical protein
MSCLIPKSMKLYIGGFPISICEVYLTKEQQLIHECDGHRSLQSLIEENLSDESHDGERVDGEISRTSDNAQIQKIIDPSASDWEDFRNLLDKLKVWDWEKEYEASKTRVRSGARITQEIYDAQVKEIMSQPKATIDQLMSLELYDAMLLEEDAIEPRSIILDGTSWKVSIEYEDRQIESEGHNAYPCLLSPKVEAPTTTGDWKEFCEGICKLAGGNEFG